VRLDEGDEEPEGGDAEPVDAQRPCRDGDPGDRDRGDLAEVQREQLHDEEDGGDREGDRDATRACDGDARYGTGTRIASAIAAAATRKGLLPRTQSGRKSNGGSGEGTAISSRAREFCCSRSKSGS